MLPLRGARRPPLASPGNTLNPDPGRLPCPSRAEPYRTYQCSDTVPPFRSRRREAGVRLDCAIIVVHRRLELTDHAAGVASVGEYLTGAAHLDGLVEVGNGSDVVSSLPAEQSSDTKWVSFQEVEASSSTSSAKIAALIQGNAEP